MSLECSRTRVVEWPGPALPGPVSVWPDNYTGRPLGGPAWLGPAQPRRRLCPPRPGLARPGLARPGQCVLWPGPARVGARPGLAWYGPVSV